MGRKSNLRKKFGRLKIRNEGEGSGIRNENRTQNEEDGERITADNADDQDRISHLPERVLANILSSLEIEEAVRTSVLSKSWVKKWTNVCNLLICDGIPFPKKNFLNSVERVLKKILCIKEFALFCFHKQDPFRVKALIAAALNSDVLDSLCAVLPHTEAVFSPSFFRSNSLTKLELMACTFVVSDRLCFNHLRSLVLFEVEFQNQGASSSSELLFIMPMLEVFKLHFCIFSNVKSLNIHAPLLSSLDVIQCKYDSQINGATEQYGIEITSGSNTNFTYSGALEEVFSFSNPSAVTSASLHIRIKPIYACQHFLQELGSRARLLLERFSASLKMLELSEDVIMALAHWLPPVRLPMFNKLKQVEVHLLWFVSDCLHTSAVDLLKNAPVLESLTIFSGESRVSRKCNECRSRVPRTENRVGIRGLPSDFLSHLKSVEFRSCHGWDEEIQLVKFLLLFAPVLEELRILCKGQAVAKRLENLLLIIRTASPRISMELLVVK